MAEFVIARVRKYVDFPTDPVAGGGFVYLGPKYGLWCSVLAQMPMPTHRDIADFAGANFRKERLVATGTWRFGFMSDGEPVEIFPQRSGTLEWGPGDGEAVRQFIRKFPDLGNHKVK
jgi:hypothetical protein